jgi:GR25 family glycosyltransferase involved in LPS biosynthesis
MLSESLRKYHDAVFVVTAPGFDERQQSAAKELGDGNFEFIFGLNESATSKEELIASGAYDELRAVELDNSKKPMTVGHICRSIAHANAYRLMVAAGIDRALIFEDDVTVPPFDEGDVLQILANAPDDAELIYWGWEATMPPLHAPLKKWLYKRQHDLGLLTYTHPMIDNLYPREFNEYFLLAGKTFFAHAYSLTRLAAEKVLEINSPVVMNADNAIMHAVMSGEIKAYLSKTQLFGQRSHLDSASMPSLTQS